jgi:hypothetical protein
LYFSEFVLFNRAPDPHAHQTESNLDDVCRTPSTKALSKKRSENEGHSLDSSLSSSPSPKSQGSQILFISPKCSKSTSLPVKKLMSPKDNVFPNRDSDEFTLPPKSPKRITTPQRKHTLEALKDFRELKRQRVLSQSDEEYFSAIPSSPLSSNFRVSTALNNLSQEFEYSQDERVGNSDYKDHVNEFVGASSSPKQTLSSSQSSAEAPISSLPPSTQNSISSNVLPLKTMSFLDILAKGRFLNENRVRDPQSLSTTTSQKSSASLSSTTNTLMNPFSYLKSKEADRDFHSDEPSDMELSQHIAHCNDSFESDNSLSSIYQTPPFPKSALSHTERYYFLSFTNGG